MPTNRRPTKRGSRLRAVTQQISGLYGAWCFAFASAIPALGSSSPDHLIKNEVTDEEVKSIDLYILIPEYVAPKSWNFHGTPAAPSLVHGPN